MQVWKVWDVMFLAFCQLLVSRLSGMYRPPPKDPANWQRFWIMV